MTLGIYTILPNQLYQAGSFLRWDLEGCLLRLRVHSVTAIINLWRDDARLPAMLEWYEHHPISDGKCIDGGLDQLVARAVGHTIVGGRVLAICHAGRNRSGLLAALIVRQIRCVSGEEALAIVRAARPRAVANPGFESYLCGLDKP